MKKKQLIAAAMAAGRSPYGLRLRQQGNRKHRGKR